MSLNNASAQFDTSAKLDKAVEKMISLPPCYFPFHEPEADKARPWAVRDENRDGVLIERHTCRADALLAIEELEEIWEQEGERFDGMG